MNKTNIIVTLGPSTNTVEVIKELILGGTSVFRFNLNYLSHSFCRDAIDKIRKVDSELDTVTGIMFDTVGPDIKTGKFSHGKAYFNRDVKIRIYNSEFVGDETKFYVDYYDLINIKIGTNIKINNGKVILNVIDKGSDYLLCEVIQDGEIIDNSSVFIDDYINLPFLSKKDKDDIMFAHEMNIDFLSISNIRSSEDVLDINDLLIELGNDHMSVISKIEKKSAIEDIDDIIKLSDGIMLTRGDLGVEIPIERIPGIQKMVINKCNFMGKISIIATEVLSSMENSLIPTRAEVADIANSVMDGVDALVLTLETMMGHHPIEALSVMKKIIIETESNCDYNMFLDRSIRTNENDITGCLSHSAVMLSNELSASAIVIPTISGYTAKKISRFRPKSIILALSPNINTVKSLKLYYGVYPIYIKELKNLDDTIERAREYTLKKLDISSGKIIITGGYPFKKTKHTNFIKVEEIGGSYV